MTSTLASASNNRTTVRFNTAALHGLLERLLPKLVLDRAFEAWCTPPRPRRPRAPKEGRPFELDTPLGPLKAWEWGMRDDAESVLLVHGWGASAVTMEKLARPLADAGRQVVAIDLPAHGLNPPGTTHLIELALAIESVLWRLRPSAVVAHSLGASATALALERSPKVPRVVLLAPGEDVAYFAHAFAARAGLSQAVALGILSRIEQRVGVAPAALSLRHHPPPAATEVLVVHDPADSEVPWSHAEELMKAWPRAQLLASPGVGHHLMPRVESVIAAATAFVLEGKTQGRPIFALTA
jgi:pimeloyl-ACP methyl ester carboxylesterase